MNKNTEFSTSEQPYIAQTEKFFHGGKIAIIMVGLPARGKTHLSVSICRYLRWLGVKTHVFHLGDYRRKNLKKGEVLPEDYFYANPSEKTKEFRNSVLSCCKIDIIKFFDSEEGQVAIYDAVNPRISDRQGLATFFAEKNIQPLFIESLCDDPDIIEENVRNLKISSPDYAGWKPEDAVKDYFLRIKNRIPIYETIVEHDLSYIKIININQKLIINNANIGYLHSRIIFYLMNLHIKPRVIYFARACNSLHDSNFKKEDDFSDRKKYEYATALVNTLLKHRETLQNQLTSDKNKEIKDLMIWTPISDKICYIADLLRNNGYIIYQRPQLRQINLGMVEDMTLEEIKEKYPLEIRCFQENPNTHRFPRGESMHDLRHRLEPVIFEIEKESNDILIVAHISVIKLLYAYFMNTPTDKIPFLNLPKNQIIKIIPGAYICTETRIHIPITLS
ncbi:hypothetical protein PNEG_03608 [Pneumocystis murina B123]|uniref:6-phosphofructo-2-kinase n=1 Tax=Pneumocystis murina (strain B123) TaxID=1069680 RepID=M7PJ12_PNEMU|nr:hypothetical protein PNEG_03608 [Pneumocystis murina B123]EMR10439.1 hypothetical protein PNEG_03608 [Pneumocystis murina B123]